MTVMNNSRVQVVASGAIHPGRLQPLGAVIHGEGGTTDTPRNTFPSPRGFTLFEILVSMAIIAIVLVSLFRMQGGSILVAEKVRFNAVAPGLAQQKLSEIALTISHADDGQGDFGEAFPQYTWQSVITELSVPDEAVLSDKGAEKLKRIDVTISRGERLTYTLGTWVYHEPDL